ncbi:exonuclease domain-containing protein [Sulfurimonas paralvinellae]|uniref:3'-5' exonuclease n=1 Tax=Sulfurimonas paralvinellae TaxID=317658 RepID=A0A7M1BBI1_9BACT|nr:exonuclease domain-containing protein [Sulfurimonas paralvinellae]QOP46152.1 3'-5' exonuclease [Sulfurimonas paralvinellae]
MLIFLDIETTGYEKEDKICSLGMLCFEDEKCVSSHYELVNEGKKIPPSASALHNITNEMIAKKPALRESESYAFLEQHNREENTIIVHNMAFVLDKLQDVGLIWHGKIIDTLKVVKHLIPECEVFTLEFLHYELKLYKNEAKLKEECGIKDALISHHALSDAAVIKLLFDYLTQMTTLEEMNRLSFENVLLEKFSFGKYSGRYIEDIAINDRGYLMWMLHLENLDDDLRYSIEYYLEG